jgi:hypothetical protein
MNNSNDIKSSFKKAGFSNSDIQAVYAGIARIRAEEKNFSDKFEKGWNDAFIASECFYVLITKAVNSCLRHTDKLSKDEKSSKIYTFTALDELQRRAAQQYLEILTLIKHGFPDGAFARWRSMYELSVIGAFILKYGEAVAEKFIEASGTQDRYDWAMASGEFPETKRHVTFGDILRLCDIDNEAWKEGYTAANQTVHASPQGTFGRLGSQDGSDTSSRRSDYGIAAPAIESASTLALLSSMLCSIYQDENTTEIITLAANWLEELTDIYCNTHDNLFPDDTEDF